MTQVSKGRLQRGWREERPIQGLAGHSHGIHRGQGRLVGAVDLPNLHPGRVTGPD